MSLRHDWEIAHRIQSSETCPGADSGFFLVGGALVSCSTSTPINHMVFFAEYQLYWKTAGHLPPPRSASAVLLFSQPQLVPYVNQSVSQLD